MKKATSLLLLGITAAILVVGFFTYIGYSNTEIKLRQQVLFKKKSVDVHHDNMWKILQQQAGVTSQQKEIYDKAYPEMMKAQNNDKNLMMKFVTQMNPAFDISLLDKLMTSIAVERKQFTADQDELMDIEREHTTMLMTFPASFFLCTLGGREPLNLLYITSTRTREASKTGVDDDVDLFKK